MNNKIPDTLKNIEHKMNQYLKTIVCALLIFLVFLTFLQVVMRYIFNNPFTFAEELLRVSLVWLAMIGSAYGIGARKHMCLVFLKERLTGIKKIVVTITIDLIVIIFLLIVFVIGGTKFSMDSYGSITAAMQLNKTYVYSIIPISGVIGIIMQILCLVNEVYQECKLNHE